MHTGNMSWQSLDYLEIVERAAFHWQIRFKVFLLWADVPFNDVLNDLDLNDLDFKLNDAIWYFANWETVTRIYNLRSFWLDPVIHSTRLNWFWKFPANLANIYDLQSLSKQNVILQLWWRICRPFASFKLLHFW